MRSTQINTLTINYGYDDEEKYKVWPTNEDRTSYRQVMDAKNPTELKGVETRMALAYTYFHDEATKWLVKEATADRIPALDAALKDSLRLIVLDLDKTDEPQAIFETLNAHGTPLLPADLIKNWLLWEAAGEDLVLDTLYQRYWLPFDREQDFWRAEVGTGHAARARIDTFLQNWLTMRSLDFVPVKHLYDKFTKRMDDERTSPDGHSKPCDVKGVMGDIDAHAKRFHYIDAPTGKTRFDTFLRRLSTLGLVVFHPFLLALMARTASDAVDRDRIASILESYLVRRMICNLDTRGYGTLCLSLLGALKKAGEKGPASTQILTLLSQETGKAIAWPSDEAFGKDWMRRQFYGSIRRERVVMLLRAIEEYHQAHDLKAEPILHFDYSKLQIEHVMPQSWREHWSVEGEEAARFRETKINTVGNLTLVSGKLNPSLSNAPWIDPLGGSADKRNGLDAHSMLRLNAHLVKNETWDEQAIESRAQTLFDVARTIWLAPLRLV